MAKYGNGHFGFDSGGRICRLSRADRNRLRRGLDVRTVGARPERYKHPPRLRDWHRAFAKLPPDVVLASFAWRAGFSWDFALQLVGDSAIAFSVRCPSISDATSVSVFKRGRRRTAAAMVAEAVRRLRAQVQACAVLSGSRT